MNLLPPPPQIFVLYAVVVFVFSMISFPMEVFAKGKKKKRKSKRRKEGQLGGRVITVKPA